MPSSHTIRRREFLSAALATTAATTVPRSVLGGPHSIAPSDKISIAFVGCGSQGLRQMMGALPKTELQIVAVCDVNRKSDDYPEWGRHELRDKIRRFLEDPAWGANARGGLCGREVGREVVDRHYAKARRGGDRHDCRTYVDFREMLDQERDLDAVYIMTPDHLHGTIAVRAMRAGMHVIMHKPLANVLSEARLARDTAIKTGAATHLFCAADQGTTATLCEWIESGAIGPVREVHNWSTRPFWPQGMTHLPVGTQPVPDGFQWDLWLGPVPQRAYNPAYTHAVFRGWYDFGTGALGDMGHYSFHQIFRILKLGPPVSVEAQRSQYWKIEDFTWKKQVNMVSYPRAATIRWEFPAREALPAVSLTWYDGGLRPPLPEELARDGEELPDEGILFVGDKGKILTGFTGTAPRLIPKARMRDFEPPPETLPRPIGELDQWIRAYHDGPPSAASFDRVYPFAETILLGTIALRVDGKLDWDSQAMDFTAAPAASQLLRRHYRPGWEL
jgi:predicted dehydrogenase